MYVIGLIILAVVALYGALRLWVKMRRDAYSDVNKFSRFADGSFLATCLVVTIIAIVLMVVECG